MAAVDEARLLAKARCSELLAAIDEASLHDDGLKASMRLNNAAGRLACAVRDYGSLLPRKTPEGT